jgi:ABC-type transport system substrate-binding protein
MLTSNPLKSVKHEDPRIDEYHKRISTTVDPAERRKVLWEAEYYVAIDRAYVVNWSREEAVIAYRTYIKGIWVPHARVHDLADNRTTWIDKSLR